MVAVPGPTFANPVLCMSADTREQLEGKQREVPTFTVTFTRVTSDTTDVKREEGGRGEGKEEGRKKGGGEREEERREEKEERRGGGDEEAMRMKDSDDMPKIPAQVIGSDDAKKIVEKVRLEVNNKFEVKTCYNIIGTIKGAVEPDRYSVTGTHHDAWLYGAVDPSSATAALIELTRLLGNEVRRGWRPRRTMVFCIWGAEEIAIAGSQEWVEDKFLLLHHGAVGYTNVDNCVSGTMFFAYASPPFTNLVQEATKVVPFDDKQSLYEMWTDYVFNKAKMNELPITVPHGGADNNAFNHFAGVPAVAFTFRQDAVKYGYGSYPSYHTAYETLHLYETYYDPTYKYMSLCTKLFGVLSVTLAESYILPYNFSSVAVRYKLNLMKLLVMEKHLNDHDVSLDWLKQETDGFAAAAVKWHNTINAERQTMSITVPHGGADNNAFNHFAGVPAVAFTFRQDAVKYGYGSYPSYHTAYETLHLYETYYDPTYKYMSLCTKLFGVLSVTLAESYILPYNFSSVAVRYKLNLMKLLVMEKHLNDHDVSLDWLKQETDGFAAAAVKWHNTINAERQTMSDTKVRMLNDRMLLIEKTFLKQEGVKDRPTLRHIGLAPQLSNAYAGTGYPVIHDTVYIANRTKDGTPESKAAWDIIRRNINDCCLAMRNAKIMLDTELII
ncbi:glutamate carboxypeptidase 2-like [Ixodes scapularis]